MPRSLPMEPFDLDALLEDPERLVHRLTLAFALERPRLLRMGPTVAPQGPAKTHRDGAEPCGSAEGERLGLR